MSFLDNDDFANRHDIVLDEDEQGGLVLIPGQIVFHDLYAPSNGGNDEYEEKYSVTFRLPQESEFASRLFAVCEAVGEKVWKRDAEEKMAAVWDCIDKGVAPKNSNINILDGNLINPEYNRGSYQIKATRREDEGAPTILDQDSNVLEWDPTDKDSVKSAAAEGPRKGDYCFIQIRVWAQKKRERMNFSLEGVMLAERGTLRVQTTDRKQVAAKFGKVKALPAGFTRAAIGAGEETSDEEVTVKKAKPAAKAAAKAKPVKKGVFRR